MSEFLALQQDFSFDAEESFDEIPDGQPRIELSNLRRVAFSRPDRLAAVVSGDTLNRKTVYDGRRLNVLDRSRNVYIQMEMPTTVDAALDLIVERYGLTLPLADFLYSDPYQVMMEGVTFGRYLGLHSVRGIPCHHLVFAQDSVEWQIWIDAGPSPWPRKFVITYVSEAGEPQYAAVFTRWTTEQELPADLFVFSPPPDAERVAMTKLDPRLVKPVIPQ